MLDRRVSIAPMMDWTDRHDRFFLRLISPHVLLYTEMVTTGALIYGDRQRFLRFDPSEHPVALQLGGCDPKALADCARMGEDYGYDEINLNIGCPSDRVKNGNFGACLMAEPALVGECIAAMKNAVKIPVTVKCRIGIDDKDSYDELTHFVRLQQQAGCDHLIVHARKAWLQGLSPKQNREVPPLKYSVVHTLKKDFPTLGITINGGIKTITAIKEQLQYVDGVMVGREAYTNPYFLAAIEKELFHNPNVTIRQDIIPNLIDYVKTHLLEEGAKLSQVSRHILGLFQSQPGAKKWRRYLSENACLPEADERVLLQALSFVST